MAPEGLSRFYLEGFSGKVGATWMTREDRLNDIDNYLRDHGGFMPETIPNWDLILK